MTTTLIVGGAILGLLIGSFVNVVAYRVPAGISVVRPPSACPHCDALIRHRDNIPVLGWVLLRGRCRSCGESISVRYPIVEAATSMLFAAAAGLLGPVWVLPAYWWFIATTVVLSLTDLDVKRIPNRILYPGLVVGAVLLGAGALADDALGAFGRSVLGAGLYFGFLLMVALLARGGFGFGDVKLAALLGLFAAYRSWGSLWVANFAGFVIGGLVGVALLTMRKVDRKHTIPFGPAMVIGAYVAIAWGDDIVSWYLG